MNPADHTSASATPATNAPEPGTTPRNFIEASLRAPVVGPIVFAACLAILIIGLRYTAEILAPLFLVITLAILVAPCCAGSSARACPAVPPSW
jgi:hypothetical protein